MKRVNHTQYAIGAVLAIFATVLTPLAVSAVTGNTTVNAVIATTITITTSGTVNLAITPVSGGAQTTASDTVTVTTNNATGYNLSLKDGDATTALTNGGNNIPAASGTTWGSPAILANNTWGYGIATSTSGLTAASGFDATYSALSNQPTDSHKFLGIKTTDQLLRTTAAAAGSGDVTTVWYSAKVDMTKAVLTYTTNVVYTALTN